MKQWIQRRDFHLHTSASDGQESMSALITAALRIGLVRIAITDHFESGHAADATPKLAAYLSEYATIKETAAQQGLVVLLGLETGVDAQGQLLAPTELTQQADVIIASVHRVDAPAGEQRTNPLRYWQRYCRQVLAAVATPGVQVIGHVEGYLPIDYTLYGTTTFIQRRQIERQIAAEYIPLSWYQELGKLAAAKGVAIELHGMSRSPRPAAIRILKQAGTLFSVGSDAHRLAHLGCTDYIGQLTEELQLLPEHFAPFTH